jgi:hypothetical protein
VQRAREMTLSNGVCLFGDVRTRGSFPAEVGSTFGMVEMRMGWLEIALEGPPACCVHCTKLSGRTVAVSRASAVGLTCLFVW